jgi:chromosome segregation ATPase
MSPGRSVKPGNNGKIKSRRAALNRAAYALSAIRKAQENHARLRRNLQQKARNIENAEEKAEQTYKRFRRNIKKLQKLVHGATPNRAANALSALRKARGNHAQIRRNIENAADKAEQNYERLRRNIEQKARNIEKLQKEYYKLGRRAATFSNANMRSGQLNASELATLRHSANMTKAVSTGIRTMRRIELPLNVKHKILHNIQLI